MANEPPSSNRSAKSEFEEIGDHRQPSLVHEFLWFIIESKKWWLIPILLVFAIVGALLVLGSTGAAPFIYTLF